jgi:hypothetical protein
MGSWKKAMVTAQLFWPTPLLSNDFWMNPDHYSFKSILFFLTTPLLSKIFNFLILTRMSDMFGLDSHERIGHSWIIPGFNHSKYYLSQESTKLTGSKLQLPIQWDLVRSFFRTNDDYPDYSGANLRLPKGNQV